MLDGDWDDRLFISGGGSFMDWKEDRGCRVPAAFAATLYLNYKMETELTLLPVEGGAWVEP